MQRCSLFGKLKNLGLNHTIRVKRNEYCGIFHSIDTLKTKENNMNYRKNRNTSKSVELYVALD